MKAGEKCQVTKIIQFSNELDVLYSREIIHGLGEFSAPQAVECSSCGIWGKREFHRELEEAAGKEGVIG